MFKKSFSDSTYTKHVFDENIFFLSSVDNTIWTFFYILLSYYDRLILILVSILKNLCLWHMSKYVNTNVARCFMNLVLFKVSYSIYRTFCTFSGHWRTISGSNRAAEQNHTWIWKTIYAKCFGHNGVSAVTYWDIFQLLKTFQFLFGIQYITVEHELFPMTWHILKISTFFCMHRLFGV